MIRKPGVLSCWGQANQRPTPIHDVDEASDRNTGIVDRSTRMRPIGWEAAGVPGDAESGSNVSAELEALRRENAELRRANEILRTASALFAAAEVDRRLRRSSIGYTSPTEHEKHYRQDLASTPEVA